MPDVMQTVKDEVLDDRLIASCKRLIEDTRCDWAIVFICNSIRASRHMLTINAKELDWPPWREMIKRVAKNAQADAIVTIVTSVFIHGEQYMSITVETLLDRYSVVYPYEQVGKNVIWKDPEQLTLIGRYGDLLPAPAGMARA